MAQLVPVDNDPFATPAQPQLVPVDVDPFAQVATPPIDAAKIAETINRQFAQPPAEPARGALAAGTTGIQQGMTLGFGDEIMAGMLTPVEMLKRSITGEDAGKGFGDRLSGAYDFA